MGYRLGLGLGLQWVANAEVKVMRGRLSDDKVRVRVGFGVRDRVRVGFGVRD